MTKPSETIQLKLILILIVAVATSVYVSEGSSANVVSQGASSGNEFRWTGSVAPGASIEVKGIDGDITAVPATGSEVEVVATKTARRGGDINLVDVKVIEHAGGVTICAVYPSGNRSEPNTCSSGQGGRTNIRNNDIKVDFAVKVPAGVALIARTINGEISATNLTSNVTSSTVNGEITISTSGYAQAVTVNGEIHAKMGDANWPNALEFKTVNGEISLDLPASLSTEVKINTFNGAISSEFPFTAGGKMNARQVVGTIGNGGRSLTLKTLNGNVTLRRG